MKKHHFGVSDVDSPQDMDVEVGKQQDLRRSLRPRHLQMIAIGGVIGELHSVREPRTTDL